MKLKEYIEKFSYDLTKAIKKLDYLLMYESKNETQKKYYIKLINEGIVYSKMLLELNDNKGKLSKEYIEYELNNIQKYCKNISNINKKDLPF